MRIDFVLVIIWSVALGGCYNGQELVARISERASDDHKEEVDLGAYQVTLPRGTTDPVSMTVKLDVVATIRREKAAEFKQQLEEVRPHLRHATILALRQSGREELLEPALTSLHERIKSTTEAHLTAAPIESIAFRSFAVYED